MKANKVSVIIAVVLATGSALAQDAHTAALTRAEVRQSVIEARSAGRLAHTGSVAPEEEMRYAQAHRSTSALTRDQQKVNVMQARSAGQLAHSGSVAPEEEMKYARAHPSISTLTRQQVKAEVIEARANGELVPAGEGAYVYQAHRVPDHNVAMRWLK